MSKSIQVSPSFIPRFESQKLNQFTRAPEYIAYLAYILSSMTGEEDRIRTIAGYLLKNNSRLILGSPPAVAEYVKGAVLQAFNDPSIMIRNAASQDIVAFLGVLEPKNWPECLQQLVNTLDSTDLDRQEVSSLPYLALGRWRAIHGGVARCG
jgi:transportin-1